MTCVRSYLWLAACLNLFMAQPSLAVESDTVQVQALVTLINSGSMNLEFDESHPTWWSTTGNPSDYIGQFAITVRVGTAWDYVEYRFTMNEPNFDYHYETFLPENFLANKDPYGEAEYASLSTTNHVIDRLYFADPEMVMVAATSGRLDTTSKFSNNTIRTFF